MNIFEASQRGYKHKNLIFWMGILKSLTAPIRSDETVLDFGCGYGMFLQLLYETYRFKYAVGVDVDVESIEIANQFYSERQIDWPIKYMVPNMFEANSRHEEFDLIFSQEVFWMNQDLHAIAKLFYKMLKPGGRCYCTIGSHNRNPLWSHRKELMESQGIETNTHDIDNIAAVFTQAGFAVGMRRLPIDGYIMYHPEATTTNSRSFAELVSTTHEQKMLFYFGKHQPVGRAARLQG